MSTVNEYFESLRGKSVAVIGMGVSNTPLIRMMLRAGLKVTVKVTFVSSPLSMTDPAGLVGSSESHVPVAWS